MCVVKHMYLQVSKQQIDIETMNQYPGNSIEI